ncbi:hypothetical protein SEA_GODPHATHER_6 [Mycobacterium phage GodPhather]|nr:hypothetical protein SEA_ARGIE_6 [Mycobacterium phage Argie]QBP32579.1 hypothetical protein SEA_GODPHATHER_6 [Mycobacterium phage GodPhather]
MTASRYRKKPVEVDAEQWDGTAEGAASIIEWMLSHGVTARYRCANGLSCPGTVEGHTLSIETLEGTMQASPGDYVIRGVQGEFYPCKPDIFATTYDPL